MYLLIIRSIEYLSLECSSWRGNKRGEVTALVTLRRGSSGTEVNGLQLILQRLGYNPGVPDGIFGMNTMQAVIQFQKDNGLKPDGVVDPITWRALQSTDQGYQLYTVQSGDTFYKISLKFIVVGNPTSNIVGNKKKCKDCLPREILLSYRPAQGGEISFPILVIPNPERSEW